MDSRPHIVAGLSWLAKQGKTIGGSILNVGSAADIFGYRRFFPKATRYRNLDKRLHKNVDIVANVQDMPQVESEGEDCVLAHRMLEQVHDIDAAMKEFRRVLKSDGVLLASFVGPSWEARKISWERRLKMKMYVFTREEAIEHVEKHFEITDIQEYFENNQLFWTFIRATPK